ncbi:hypothetical protein BJX61DRAFT_514035 [Aspergillus egyptiacus]|nr:hypothetical protein BJX61DRAFT_514035 [Aspergillus egyptiacus]
MYTYNREGKTATSRRPLLISGCFTVTTQEQYIMILIMVLIAFALSASQASIALISVQ